MDSIRLVSTDTAGACACGDDFRLLLAPHVAALHAVARNIVARDDLVCDVVQETLLTLWLREEQPPDLRGWLVRTVVHKCLHVLRREDRRGRHEESAGRDRAEECPLCDPALAIEEGDLRDCLDAAIADLSDEQRTALLLRTQRGLDYEAIAESLAVPVGTVRSRLARARAAVAAHLAGAGLAY